ncbi:thioredoxin family protein [Agathobaculum sp. NTUH-O15-33]|uniref:thioredoxin family protein n=1 Tax=Agathobaculum sp. NTUH-O15-33 TaxID=3079302 RepID=UPI002958CBF2|nr:thioredoxin family protein [Agathobaculum sp. NTUH-O15-33]WNX83874.1 thioredoxin family protein [Agathobaculum sp. NTUH-O15-33]
MKKRLLTITLATFIVIGCTVVWHSSRPDNLKTITTSSVLDYDTDENVVYDTFSDPIQSISQLTDNQLTGFIYFGRDTCPFCLEFNAYIEKAITPDISLPFYKFDTDTWREDDDFQNVLDKYNIEGIPSVILIHSDKTFTTFTPDESSSSNDLISSLNSFFSTRS